nr:hypothetical protein [Gammaproteobacteria bacterium]
LLAPLVGTVTLLPGQTVNVAVDTFDDTLVEGNETFVITLDQIQNATPGDITAIGTIIENDNVFDGRDINSSEADEGDVIRFEVSAPPATSNTPVLTQYTISFPGTGPGNADASDLVGPLVGTVLLTPGQNVDILVNTAEDTAFEGNETFVVTLEPLPGNTSTISATGIIIDDDAPTTTSVLDDSAIANAVGELGMLANTVSLAQMASGGESTSTTGSTLSVNDVLDTDSAFAQSPSEPSGPIADATPVEAAFDPSLTAPIAPSAVDIV